MMSLGDLPDPLSKPSIADFSVLCRVCLRKGCMKVQIQPIGAYIDRLNPEREQDLYEKIRMCSDIKIEENEDLLPNNICDKCVNLLLIAYYFKTLSAASDKILRNILNSNGHDKRQKSGCPSTKIKIEYENQSDWDEDHTSWSDGHPYATETSIPNDDNWNSRVFVCDMCQQEFSDKSSLSDHLNSHDTVNKFKDSRLCSPKVSASFNGKIKNKTLSIRKYTKTKKLHKRKDNLKQIKSNEHENVYKGKEIKVENFESKEETNNPEDKMTGYFECLVCNTSFEYKEDLSRHMFSHDVTTSKYKCYGCDVVYDKYSERTHHEKFYCPKMPPGTKYQCSKCKAECENRFRFDTHVKFGCAYKPMRPESKTIELEPLLKCQHCDLTTMNKATLRNHILNCHTENKPYICEICGKGYAMVSSLNSHRKQSHTTEKKYKCSYCPYAARQQSSLNVHTRRHTLEYRYSCEICGASFKQNTGYHIHMRRYHREKEHQCEICKKMFSEKAAMKQHVSSVHLGLKPHECKVCGAAFSRKRSLKAHLFRAHNIAMAKNALYEKVIQVSALPSNETTN